MQKTLSRSYDFADLRKRAFAAAVVVAAQGTMARQLDYGHARPTVTVDSSK